MGLPADTAFGTMSITEEAALILHPVRCAPLTIAGLSLPWLYVQICFSHYPDPSGCQGLEKGKRLIIPSLSKIKIFNRAAFKPDLAC